MSAVIIIVERDGAEIEVECEFDYTPAHRGARDSLCGVRGAGAPLEPGEPASISLASVTPDIELTEREIERAEEIYWQSI